MSFVAVAVGAGALTSVVGGVLSAGAATDAADTQADAANRSADLQQKQYEQTREDQAPYRVAGAQALKTLSGLTNRPLSLPAFRGTAALNPGAFRFEAPTIETLPRDPGYQFRVQEGQRALERSGTAKGMVLSGPQLRALTRFGQDYGSQEYGAAYARGLGENELRYGRAYTQNQDVYGRKLTAYQTEQQRRLTQRQQRVGELSGVAGAGQGAVNTLAQIGQATAANVGGAVVGAGNAQAAGRVGAANAINTGLGGVAGAGNTYLQYKLLSQLLNRTPQPGLEALF